MSLPSEFPLNFNITATDIRLGKKNDCRKCPAARAVLRTARKYGFDAVEVGKAYIYLGNFYARFEYGKKEKFIAHSHVAQTPSHLTEFIRFVDSSIELMNSLATPLRGVLYFEEMRYFRNNKIF